MSHPATLPPALLPQQLDPFVEQSHRGLFAAPWLDRPAPSEVFAVQRLTRTLSHTAVSTDTHDDLAPVLSLLLLIRSHCMLAAIATDSREARQHYSEALKVCMTTLNLLHHETEGTPLAIATWVQGVHSLIWAQLAVPNFAEVERLARMAMIQLSGVTDPVCRGAEADAHAATRLAHEPPELARALSDLPDRVAAKEEYYRYQLDQQESLLNQRLQGIHEAYTEAFKLAVGWGALNLTLMATLPLNGFWRPDIPWSVPFVILVPVLWWATWDRPFRAELRFFDWLRWSRQEAMALFLAAARERLTPAEHFREAVTEVLRQARAQRDQLAAFLLNALPPEFDRLDESATLAARGAEVLTGTWMAEMRDSKPWALDDLLPLDPPMVPNALRIYFGR